MAALVNRYLEPSERMSELLFGLIMTLTFTLGASLVVQEGPDATRELLVGVVGCNIAWGIIDGILYMFNALYARGAPYRALRALQQHGPDFCRQKVRERLEEEYAGALSEPTKQTVCGEVLEALGQMSPPRVRMTRDDFMGALASFWLVVATAIPAVAPFLFFDNHMLAIRVSNGILIALLYLIGRQWALYINANRHAVGFGMACFGLILVQLTILLGG
jgi:VIT1/CCC1 family predicted Fe2+/Mn2+ transporter